MAQAGLVVRALVAVSLTALAACHAPPAPPGSDQVGALADRLVRGARLVECEELTPRIWSAGFRGAGLCFFRRGPRSTVTVSTDPWGHVVSLQWQWASRSAVDWQDLSDSLGVAVSTLGAGPRPDLARVDSTSDGVRHLQRVWCLEEATVWLLRTQQDRNPTYFLNLVASTGVSPCATH